MSSPTPYLTKYHLAEQHADALLGPVHAALRELERRTLHYVERLDLAPADQETLRAAQRALTAAREEIEQLQKRGTSSPERTAGTATTGT